MPGDAAKFLEYNADNIVSDLVQSEAHARSIRGGMRPEHYACILKHLAHVRGEVGEAVSHSSVAKPNITSKLQDMLSDTEKVFGEFKSGVGDSGRALHLIRELRGRFEDIFPIYNTGKCKVCETAGYGDFVKDYHSDGNGDYNGDSKILNSKLDILNISDNKVTIKTVAKEITMVVGPQLVGKGVTMGSKILGKDDIAAGKKPIARKDFWIDVAVMGIGYAVALMKKRSKYAMPALILAGYITASSIPDYANEYLSAGQAGVSLQARFGGAAPRINATLVPSTPVIEMTPSGTAPMGRYMITS